MTTTASARVIKSLREDIAAGRLKVGDRLPTRAEMRAKYGIAAMTSARVVSALVDEGLAVSDVGRGVFVTAVPAEAASSTDPWRQLEARVRTLEERVDQLGRRESEPAVSGSAPDREAVSQGESDAELATGAKP